MIPLLVALFHFFSSPDYFSYSCEAFFQENYCKQKLSFKETDHQLLNATLFHYLNLQRKLENKKILTHHSSLYQIARKNQDELEFRPFTNTEKTVSKVNKKLLEQCKNAGYKGNLTLAVVSQNQGINYDLSSPFYYQPALLDSEFHLYYGSKKSDNPTVIPAYTYLEFVSNWYNQLQKEQKKILLDETNENIGIHAQWYYKTLQRKKIPQIKTLIILGGYATNGLR